MKPGFADSRGASALICVAALLGFAFLLLPVLVIVPLSFNASTYLSYPLTGWTFDWYRLILREEPWVTALANSIKLACATMAVSTLLGTAAAYACHRLAYAGKDAVLYACQGSVRMLVFGPMLVPLVITALGLYIFLSGIGLLSSVLGLLIAHTVVAVPLVFMSVHASMSTYNRNFVRASRSLGATPVRAFFDSILPQIRHGALTGAVLAFVTSFDETVVTLFVAPPGFVTLPRHLFAALRDKLDPSIAAVATLMIAVSIVAFAVAEAFAWRTADRSSGNPT